MEVFKGCAPAVVTPFNKNGKLNITEFKRLLDFQIKGGVNAVVVLGTTGEASTLSEQEKNAVAITALEYVNGKIPVIIGAGGNNTKEVLKRSKRFAKMGADALLQVTPYYNKATQKGLIEHFEKIANAANIPQILYNVPSRTGVNILPETVKTLSNHPNIVGIKEAGGNLAQLSELLRILPKHFAVYSGDDENIFTTLALGGKGVISVVANILPKETSDICWNFFEGNFKKSRELQFELTPIIKALFTEVNPIPVKAALNAMGFNVGAPRLPLTEISQENLNKLNYLLKKINFSQQLRN